VVVFLAIVVLVLPTTSVKVFAATVIPTLECFPPRLGVTIQSHLILVQLLKMGRLPWMILALQMALSIQVHLPK
jgi:hypothetical protein